MLVVARTLLGEAPDGECRVPRLSDVVRVGRPGLRAARQRRPGRRRATLLAGYGPPARAIDLRPDRSPDRVRSAGRVRGILAGAAHGADDRLPGPSVLAAESPADLHGGLRARQLRE